MNTSVKAILYTSKTLSNGEHPVMIRLIKDRKAKYIATGFSCTKEMWDQQSGTPKKGHPLHKEAKILIGKKKLETEKLIYKLENQDNNLTAHEIKLKLKRQSINNPGVFDYFDVIVTRLKMSGQIKNAEIYKDTKRNLSYCTGQRLLFSDIDVQFLNKFEEFLKSQGKGQNTIYLYLRTFRALVNKAIKEDVCSPEYYPFKNFSLSKYSKVKTEKRAIKKEEIERISRLYLKNSPDLLLAQHIFLFSYYCRGMNFIDIAQLTWGDLHGNRFTYQRSKTKELFNIELLPPAIRILEFYKPQTYGNRKSYVFPVLNEGHKNPQTIYNRKVKMLRAINRSLKTIGEMAGVKNNLTTYVARHSYATILKKEGVPTALISQALGHESEKTTQIYLESFENEIIDQISKKALL